MHIACVQTSPSPQKNWRERCLWIAIINCVPVHICVNFVFVFLLTLEKVLTDQQDSGLLYSMYTVILNLHSWARILLASLFALRLCCKKIEGSAMFWTCEIQCAQHMISMKKLRFSNRPRTKVRHHGPQGSARAQPWVEYLAKMAFLTSILCFGRF